MRGQFEIILSKQAVKYYQRLPLNIARRLDRAFLKLELNPLSGGDIRPLSGRLSGYRLRIGDLRVIYQIDKENRLVFISAILPRGDIYK